MKINGGSLSRSFVSSIDIQFNEDTTFDLLSTGLLLVNLSTNTPVSLGGLPVTVDAVSQTAKLDLSNLLLAPGNYQLSLEAASVIDAGGLRMSQNFSTTFHVFPGDATGDRAVNDLDLYRVWQNQLKLPAQRDPSHDLNRDGQVNDTDLDTIRNNYLQLLAAPQQAQLAAASIHTLSISLVTVPATSADLFNSILRVNNDTFGSVSIEEDKDFFALPANVFSSVLIPHSET